MARGGNPNITWIEDQLLVAGLRFADLPKGSLQDFATVRSFLQKRLPNVADGSVEEFIKTVNRLRTDYVLLLTMMTKGHDISRAAARKKYKQFHESLADFARSFFSIGRPSWELIRHISCHGKPDEDSPSRDRFDALDFEQFGDRLMALVSAVSRIRQYLKGTAQDHTRPERFVVHELWSKWVELGFPEPKLVRGADPRDPAAPDEDPFAETIRLVFDTMYRDSKVVDGEVTYELRTVIEAGRKKLRAR